MRPVRDLALGCVLAGSLGACTLLIPFDEVTENDAASPPSEAGPIPPDVTTGDAGSDAPRDAALPTDASPNTNYDACVGHIDGYYCGGDQVPWPVRDDLVTCASNKVSNVRPCTTGQGCVGMLDGYPDECDECSGKADGTYCGRDFAGWKTKNANQRIRCQGGRIVGSLLCTTCKSNGTASACQ